ncbi:DUF4269 domain-containing protein [Robertkochia marina]|nr:DUF4269 domain-containing protein [Robertkochia marina]
MNMVDPGYLLNGSLSQQKVYKALRELRVFERLRHFDPVLAGTFPLDLAGPESDLDILCEVDDHDHFKKAVTAFFDQEKSFNIKEKLIKGKAVIIARFQYIDLPFEIFGQDVPVIHQDAYRHLLVEKHLLQHQLKGSEPTLKALKQKGKSTEEAFAFLLKMEGDPYEGLIALGKELGLYS